MKFNGGIREKGQTEIETETETAGIYIVDR